LLPLYCKGFLRALADQATLPLSHGSQHVGDQLPVWGGGVDPDVEHDEVVPKLVEL